MAGNESPILQKALQAMTPMLQESALSAIYVRTLYQPQNSANSNSQKAKVKRTIISQILCNNNGVKESLCDSRQVGSLLGNDIKAVKQYAFHYSNDGKKLKIFDSKNAYGTIRKTAGFDLSGLNKTVNG